MDKIAPTSESDQIMWILRPNLWSTMEITQVKDFLC